ncbi:MAG TPA: tetratricopeptide repeat protein [Streptosporangiaceae bacterium]|nr:tetratricopeptide repeat protein [Streptosporangiaceae bacterium]
MRLSGSIPPLAESFHQRPETGLDLRAGLYPGDTVVLTHGEDTPIAPAAQGGTGKTQLAVAFAHALWAARAVGALIWVSAASRDAIVTGFAQAASVVGAAGAGLGAEAAAAGFVTWLAHTRRPWALILDDLASLDDLGGLWPAGPAGQVVITTRLPETAFRTGRTGTHTMPGAHSMPEAPGASGGYEPSGGYGTSGSYLMPGGYGTPGGFGAQGAAGVTGAAGIPATPGEPRVAPVGGFSRREVLAYLGGRLTDFPEQKAEALGLGTDLDGLPLALAQAAAVMAVNQLSCAEYRGRLGQRREHMSAIRVDGISPPVLATWSLAVECAHDLPPAGAAWPALALAAMLDPNGIPAAVLTSPAGCGYVAGRPSNGDRADQALVRAAITNLAWAGLISVDPASAVRTVRMHPSVQAAVRAYLPPADFEQAVLAAAEALLQAWPDDEISSRQGEQDQAERAQLELALRDGTAALWAADGAVPRPAEGGQHARHAARPQPGAPATQPHQSMLWRPEAHPVLFRRGLSLDAGGLTGPAIAHWQAMLAAGSQLPGAGPGAGHGAGQAGARDASAVLARDRLAVAYEAAGRFGDAIAAFTSALAEREHAHGTEHPDTITARGLLAHAYASAGRPAEAVTLYEQMVAGAGRQLGAGHPVTLAARASLASAYQAAARGKEALAAYEALLADAGRLLGAGHAETLAARENLAAAYLASGQPKDAIEQYRLLVTATEATVGRDHPDAITARASLASAYRRGGKPKDAIALYQRVLADRERTAGADHPDAIAARASLAAAYRSAGQLREAIAAYERTLADRERVAGPDHAVTRAARASLAAAYQQAGRLGDAVHHYEQALADSERMLGPGDLETLTARSALAAAHVADGRPSDAIPLLRRALADSERYLGPDHPMTRTVRDNLEAATHG